MSDDPLTPEDVVDMRDAINEEWESAYPGSVPVSDVRALCLRVRKLAEDRKCWLANAQANQREYLRLDRKLRDMSNTKNER